MGDRRKPGFADERHTETDRQFLDQANIKPLMRDVLGKLLANRPEDPLAFIAHYFESLEDKSSLVTKAYNQVMLTHHSRPAFHRNLKAAYNLLCEHKVKKSLKGVSGSVYADLLIMLLREIPSPISNKLMKKIECMEFEAVTFSHFQSGVFTCCVLQDYVKLTTELFKSLDIQHTGWLDKNLSQVVLDQLTSALSQSKHQNSLSVLESAHSLGPEGLYEAIEQAYRHNPKKQGTVNLDDFMTTACEAFLLKIKSLR